MTLLCSHQFFQKAIFWKYSKTVSIRSHLEARLCLSFMQSCWQAHLHPLWSCVQAALRGGCTCNASTDTNTDTIACQSLPYEQELQGGCTYVAQWLWYWLRQLSEWALSNKLHIPTAILSNDKKPNFWVCVYLPLEDISGNKAEDSWWSVMDRDE